MPRKLVDITLDEAIQVLKFGEGYQKGVTYLLRKKINPFDKKFAQLYYRDKRPGEEESDYISVNFSDDEDAKSDLWNLISDSKNDFADLKNTFLNKEYQILEDEKKLLNAIKNDYMRSKRKKEETVDKEEELKDLDTLLNNI